MTDTMLCIRGGEVRAMTVVADDEIYREAIAEWIADPATEAILKVDVETARTAFLRPAADLIMAKLVRAVEAVGQRTPPPPSSHVATLEKEIKDLKHDLASARGQAKNATSNCNYWKRPYEALANGTPSPQPREAGNP